MDRASWLDDIRRRKVERFDTLHAPTYDDDWGDVPPAHANFVDRLLAATPPDGRVLDVACGTGRFFGQVRDAGRRVEGVDPSAGMLAQARRKHPDVPTRVAALPALAVAEPYDAVMCVDALENLPPEDWPAALAALRSAAVDHAPVYLTVELAEPAEYERAHAAAVAAGLPVVDGEIADTDGGYHYYPPRDQARAWLAGAGLEVTDEADGDDYWHVLCRAVTPSEPPVQQPPATSDARRPSARSLVTGAVAGAIGAVLLLLAAGSLGSAGLALTAVVEAVVVYAIYRRSPAP